MFIIFKLKLYSILTEIASIKEKPQSKKILLSLDDPFGALLQLAEIIADNPMQVPWDANIFGRILLCGFALCTALPPTILDK